MSIVEKDEMGEEVAKSEEMLESRRNGHGVALAGGRGQTFWEIFCMEILGILTGVRFFAVW